MKRLGKKQIEAIKNFFIKLEKYRIQTEESEICIRKNNNHGDITLFEDEANSYQYYASKVVERLIKRHIFYVRVAVNPETGRKVKVICMDKQQFNNIKDLVFKPENEIKSRF